MIEDRTAVKPGIHLTATYKKQEHSALMLEDGKVLRQAAVEDTTPLADRTYPSLSAAAHAITGVSTNGWRFWSIADAPRVEHNIPSFGGSPSMQHSEHSEPAETTCEGSVGPSASAPHGSRNFRKAPNQKGLEEGETRWWCMCCQASFKAETSIGYPSVCAEGHAGYGTDKAEVA